MGHKVLESLGVPPDVAADRRERFRKQAKQMLREQHLVYDDEAALIASSQQARQDLEKLFEADKS